VTRRPDLDAGGARAEFDRQLSGIREHLGWITKDVEAFNAGLRAKAKGRIEARREKAIRNEGVVSELGFPLRRREEAPPTYVVPAVREKPPFPTPSSGRAAAAPEPELAMAQYEEILSIIENMVTVIERSPHAFVSMSEEDLRQHFLVQLNGQFEGKATGETFNYEGKTDILIRHQGKNLFIAECKFLERARLVDPRRSTSSLATSRGATRRPPLSVQPYEELQLRPPGDSGCGEEAPQLHPRGAEPLGDSISLRSTTATTPIDRSS
jgi:hypothetical protein